MLKAMFPNVHKIASIGFSIPVSTASVRRSFSQMKCKSRCVWSSAWEIQTSCFTNTSVMFFFGFFRAGKITTPTRQSFEAAKHLSWGDVASTTHTLKCFPLSTYFSHGSFNSSFSVHCLCIFPVLSNQFPNSQTLLHKWATILNLR